MSSAMLEMEGINCANPDKWCPTIVVTSDFVSLLPLPPKKTRKDCGAFFGGSGSGDTKSDVTTITGHHLSGFVQLMPSISSIAEFIELSQRNVSCE